MSVFCERIAKYQNTKGSIIIIAGKRTYVVIAAKSVPFHLVLFHCHKRSDGFARIPHPTLPLLQRCSVLSHHRSQYARFIQLVHCHGHDRHRNLGSFRLPSLGHVSHVFGADESCTPRGTLPTARGFPCRCHRRPYPSRDYCNLTREPGSVCLCHRSKAQGTVHFAGMGVMATGADAVLLFVLPLAAPKRRPSSICANLACVCGVE